MNSTLLEGSGQNLYNPESFYLGNVIDKFTIGGKKDLYKQKFLWSCELFI